MTTLAPARPPAPSAPRPPTIPRPTFPLVVPSPRPVPIRPYRGTRLRWDWTLQAADVRDWIRRQPPHTVIGSCRAARRCMVAVALSEALGLVPPREPTLDMPQVGAPYVSVTHHAELYRTGDAPTPDAVIAVADDLYAAIRRYDRLQAAPTRERVLRHVFDDHGQ